MADESTHRRVLVTKEYRFSQQPTLLLPRIAHPSTPCPLPSSSNNTPVPPRPTSQHSTQHSTSSRLKSDSRGARASIERVQQRLDGVNVPVRLRRDVGPLHDAAVPARRGAGAGAPRRVCKEAIILAAVTASERARRPEQVPPASGVDAHHTQRPHVRACADSIPCHANSMPMHIARCSCVASRTR